jgi:hypothetical protein
VGYVRKKLRCIGMLKHGYVNFALQGKKSKWFLTIFRKKKKKKMKIFEKNWSKSILIFYPASQNRHIHVLACQYSEAFSGHNPLFRKKKKQ